MNREARSWADSHTWFAEAISAERVSQAVFDSATHISVVIPARNEFGTIAPIVEAVSTLMRDPHPIVHEVVVIDSDSTDATAEAARAAGAVVFSASDIRPDLGSRPGKGEAMWKSLFVTSGDLIVFLDADVTTLTPEYVTRLVAPLVLDPRISLVKGFYARDLAGDSGVLPGQGGRVTELVVRPLIELWWPELSGVAQPLAGEWAIRRSLMEQLSIPCGYGVEFAVLIDTFTAHGATSIAQVDLGRRDHRHQELLALSSMATEILSAASSRIPHGESRKPTGIWHPQRETDGLTWAARPVNCEDRPPMASVPGAPTAGSARR